MNLSIQNSGSDEVIATPDGAWAEVLQGGSDYELPTVDGGVVVVGDYPEVRDQIGKFPRKAVHALRRPLEAVLRRKEDFESQGGMFETIKMTISNNGPNAVCVLLGDGAD
ncbi:MAG: hypothetical protein KKC79_18300 [Gammaproteobacteria bacterium]|nr:hypothetical protein [Gammaproteobacteria bacterium]MBU1441466.1 hypothetical protein [Gammaproteobacteria bacterium]MBU2287287.1 hypothetical protein [Gammaproteobacteria bacterium]MBU2410586.1 hypothetical protein [Gammaproteobacteria bacterium]